MRKLRNKVRALAGLPPLPKAVPLPDWEQAVVNRIIYGTPDPAPETVTRFEAMYAERVGE